jgi:hypothetical protein
VILHDNGSCHGIEQLNYTRQALDKLLTCSNQARATNSRPHLDHPAESIDRRPERAGKSGKQIVRRVLSTLQIAERLDCKDDSRKWGATARVGRKNAPTAQPAEKNFAP